MATQIVKHKGKEYEIGKVYKFSDNPSADNWAAGTLILTYESGRPFCTDEYDYKYCREINPESLGKITKAKIKPEVGKVYKVADRGDTDCIIWTDGASLATGWEIICEMVEKND